MERIITVDRDGTIHQADGFTAVLSSGKVENLAKGLDNAYTFDLTLDARVFNSNDIVISVNAVDVSSNKMNTVYSETISIDITALVISVACVNQGNGGLQKR